LTDSYDKIELGSITPTLGQTLNMLTTVAQAAKQVAQDAQNNATIAWQSADGKTTTFKGSSSQAFPTAQHIGDLYWRENGDTTEVYIWDGSEWAFQFSNKTGQNISEAVDKAMAKADTAKQNANTAVETGNQALTKAQAGIDTANSAADNANTAMSNSSTAINNAKSAMTDASSAVDSANSAMTKATTALSTANSSSDIANAVKQQITDLKDGSTMTIADLENGLALKLVKSDLDGYATQSWATDQIGATAEAINVNLTKVQKQVNNSAVGTNLLVGTSGTLKTVTSVTDWSTNLPNITTNRIDLTNNTYTASVWLSPAKHDATVYIRIKATDGSSYSNIAGSTVKAGTSGYSTLTYTVPSGSYLSDVWISFTSVQTDSTTVSYKEMKLENGSVATPWCLNPTEQATQSYVSTTLEATATSLTANLESYTDTKSTNALNSAKLYADTQIKATADGLQTQVTSIKSTADKATTDITTLNQRASGWDSTISSLSTNKADQTWTTDQIKTSADSLNVNIAKVQTQVNDSAVGTNLLTGTTDFDPENWDYFDPSILSFSNEHLIFQSAKIGSGSYSDLTHSLTQVQPNTTYTLSWSLIFQSGPLSLYAVEYKDENNVTASYQDHSLSLGGNYNTLARKNMTFTTQSDCKYIKLIVRCFSGGTYSAININFKLELGTNATDYSANPADNATVTSVTNLSVTLDGIKQTVAKKVDNDTFTSYQNQTATLIGSKVSSDDFNSYKTQTDNALSQRVTSSAFSSYQTQTDSAIQQRVTSATYNAGITTLSNQISSKVSKSDLKVGGENYLLSSDTWDPSYWNQSNPSTTSTFSGVLSIDATAISSGYYDVSQMVKNIYGSVQYTLSWNLYWLSASGGCIVYAVEYKDKNNITASYQDHATVVPNNPYRNSITFTTQPDCRYINIIVRGLAGYKLQIQKLMLTDGNLNTGWHLNSSEIANYSQIQQLSDNINLRVVKNDVINQINLSTEGILIDGKRTHITGQTVIDNAVIKSAMVDTLSADKVTFGTLNGNLVNVTNINADNITAGTLTGVSFHQSSSGHDTWIDGNGVHDYDGSGNNAWIQKGKLQVYDKNGDGFFMDSGKLELTSAAAWGSSAEPVFGTIERDNNIFSTSGNGMVLQGTNGLSMRSKSFSSNYGLIEQGSQYNGSGINIKDSGILTASHGRVVITGGTAYKEFLNKLPKIEIGTNRWDPNGTGGSAGQNIAVQANGFMIDVNGGIYINSYTGNTAEFHNMNVKANSFTNTSQLSLKTNINKLDIDKVRNAIQNVDIRQYQYKVDIQNGKSKVYVSGIIDDVNRKPQYNMPYDWISDDGTGRDDGTILGYAIVALQDLYSQITSLKTEIKQLKGAA
jgi:hypothetical protein